MKIKQRHAILKKVGVLLQQHRFLLTYPHQSRGNKKSN